MTNRDCQWCGRPKPCDCEGEQMGSKEVFESSTHQPRHMVVSPKFKKYYDRLLKAQKD